MRWIVLALALLFSTSASAQCTGVFPANTLCGNLGASPAPPTAFSASGTVVGPGSSTVGDVATWANTAGTLLQDGGSLRQRLVGNLTYYVNGNSGGTATCGPAGASTCSVGNDSNNCLTPATACLTLQHAHNLAIANIDFVYTYAGNIYLAHNTGTTNYDLVSVNGPWIGTSVINVVGDSTAPTATVITAPANSAAVQCKDLCTIDLQYIAFADNVTNNGTQFISVGGTGNAGHMDITNVTFGPCTICSFIAVGNLGSLTLVGPITINGGAAIALAISNGGLLDFAGQTATVSGTPAFSTAFAYMPNGGIVGATNTTFSGAATGPRCIVAGSLNTGAYNPNAVFPGNADCVTNEYIGAIGLQTGTGGSSSFAYGTAGHALLSGGGSATKNTWDTAGVTCTVTTVSPITMTVANGIVTHC